VSCAEFELAAAACRAVFDPSAREECAERAQSAYWQRLLLVARRHRIEGLVWEGLSRSGVSPGDVVGRALHARAHEIAARGLSAAVECAELLKSFSGHDVDLLFLKGVTLGKLAFGNPFLKMSWDIDILVHEEQVGKAASLLVDRGYRPVLPEGSVAVIEGGIKGARNRCGAAATTDTSSSFIRGWPTTAG